MLYPQVEATVHSAKILLLDEVESYRTIIRAHKDWQTSKSAEAFRAKKEEVVKPNRFTTDLPNDGSPTEQGQSATSDEKMEGSKDFGGKREEF